MVDRTKVESGENDEWGNMNIFHDDFLKGAFLWMSF
jgi:hypothetical protein